MKLKRRRNLVKTLDILDQPIRFNPFLFSRTFVLWALLGLIIHHIFPDTNLTLTIVSCMAGINTCVTRTPMSTTILLATLTGFSYFIPILFASLTGYFLASRTPFISSQSEKVKE
ncbi:chloride channel protein [Algoriphagus sp.]|uniref:chloride channel protein n=1 Tax=Algoriphagus sp. TaxID=1872435 RepID=UPI0032988699